MTSGISLGGRNKVKGLAESTKDIVRERKEQLNQRKKEEKNKGKPLRNMFEK